MFPQYNTPSSMPTGPGPAISGATRTTAGPNEGKKQEAPGGFAGWKTHPPGPACSGECATAALLRDHSISEGRAHKANTASFAFQLKPRGRPRVGGEG